MIKALAELTLPGLVYPPNQDTLMKNNNTNPISRHHTYTLPPDGLSLDIVLAAINSDQEFPINFDVAWQWLQYSRKDNAKRHFLNCDFLECTDYKVFLNYEENATPGRSSETILLTVDCFKSWAMMSNTSRGKEVRKYFLECEKIAKQKVAQSPQLNIYARRVQIASKWNIPKGHWCVFHEISLLANWVGENYNVGDYDLIDGSVGLCWANYRKGKDWTLPTIKFEITFGDRRDLARVEVKGYRDEELIHFRRYLKDIYKLNNLPEYLKRKYGAIAQV